MSLFIIRTEKSPLTLRHLVFSQNGQTHHNSAKLPIKKVATEVHKLRYLEPAQVDSWESDAQHQQYAKYSIVDKLPGDSSANVQNFYSSSSKTFLNILGSLLKACIKSRHGSCVTSAGLSG